MISACGDLNRVECRAFSGAENSLAAQATPKFHDRALAGSAAR
jgi:hypothetical protein